MDVVIAWIVANPEAAAAVAGLLLDLIAGAIPDKALAYKGIVRRALKWLLEKLEK
jgi:hypothetical protein